jgi:hypothetical protein
MMLAQAIDNVSAAWWKEFSIALIALIVLAGIYAVFRKPAKMEINDKPAIQVEKVSKRYNHDLLDQRFGRIEVRLDGHDAEIDQAWAEMKVMREDANKIHLGIAVSLAKIETKLGIGEKQS